MNKSKKTISLFFLLICSVFLSAGLIGSYKDNQAGISLNYPLSSADIDAGQIAYDASVERVFGSITFTVDLSAESSKPHTSASAVTVTIDYGNDVIQNKTLIENNDVWSQSFTIEANASLGNALFNVTVKDGAYYYSDDFTFEILDSKPMGSIWLSADEIYRGETIEFNVTPSDAEDSISELTWTTTIKRGSNGATIATTSDQLNGSYTFAIASFDDNEIGEYYVELEVTDNDDNSTVIKSYFNLLNNLPQLVDYDIEYVDTEYTNPDADECLRATDISVIVNVSDAEYSLDPDLKMKIFAEGPRSNTINLVTSVDAEENSENNEYYFESTFSIDKYQYAGDYELNFVIYEEEFGIDYNTTITHDFTVVNNLPDGDEITYTINEKDSSVTGLKIAEFETIKFQINVTDVDLEGIEYIRICLVDSNGEWSNYTIENDGDDINSFSIRARDLEVGQWVAYVYAVDSDGASVVTSNLMSFDIEEDTFSSFLPYLMLIAGVIVGFGITFAVMGMRIMRLKKNQAEMVEAPVEEEIPQKRSSKSSRRIQQMTQQKKGSTKAKIDTKKQTSKPKPSNKRKMMRKLD